MWLNYHAPEFSDSIFEPGPIFLSVIGNVLHHGPYTRTGEWRYLDELAFIHGPDGLVYGEDNHTFDIEGNEAKVYDESVTLLEKKPVWPPRGGLEPLPADQVEEYVLANAGARPWDRDEIDQRIVETVKERTGKIPESQEEVGGYPQHEEVMRADPLEVPMTGRKEWLAELGKEQ